MESQQTTMGSMGGAPKPATSSGQVAIRCDTKVARIRPWQPPTPAPAKAAKPVLAPDPQAGPRPRGRTGGSRTPSATPAQELVHPNQLSLGGGAMRPQRVAPCATAPHRPHIDQNSDLCTVSARPPLRDQGSSSAPDLDMEEAHHACLDRNDTTHTKHALVCEDALCSHWPPRSATPASA